MIPIQYIVLVTGLILIIIGVLILFLPEKNRNCTTTKILNGCDDGSGEIFEGRCNKGHIEHDYDKNKRSTGGAVVMIGPIPIIWGSDPKVSLLMMIIALIIMVLWFSAIRTI